MSPTPSHEPFASAVRSGNFQVAGDWLVRSFASEVFGLCQAIVRDRAAAEDLSQEVFARAFAGLSGYRGDASARTWLLAIARNRCIDHLRAQQRWAGFDEDGDPDTLPEETSLPPSVLSRRGEIDLALQDLTEIERGLIVLRFRHGLAYDELAQAFGLKTGTARMRVSRALAKMRDSLEPRSPARLASIAPASRSAPPLAQAPKSLSEGAPAPAAPRSGLLRSRRATPLAPAGSVPSAPSALSPPPAAKRQERHVLSEYFESTGEVVSRELFERLGHMASSLAAGRDDR